ncbi:fructose-1,6-bisphosphatase [Psychrosphaera sp. B3R10]|uniref:class 1 fructose-bisphosphatase n=1 Tax=unclassified Psychrosphaera TaxID=2641570 RepID=UPI001C08D3EC|nr:MULTISPECIES: class 1 fructose-bisphosphatase [unclassified Psychrosphaera]MBU2881030.1 fructose-1,6-bisphosphatase [Psychrosphaera sp. I2R16]MBU2989954.1 fructose-1,6-bisphosphatase [Psychrosphaera sp. B3R10]MDO6719155.1 class 1 fructose-bisphosphatase [Psychrosphaera sp. 1_MG-2023]
MKRLTAVLKRDNVESELIIVIRTILAASKEIAFRVSQGALGNVLGSTLSENVQGEIQKKLDVIANDLLKTMLLDESSVMAIASEEEDYTVVGNKEGKYLIAFDPLDGSSNIDVNGQIGTIFTIYAARSEVPADDEAQFFQHGSAQLCAGYILYGAATMLVMTTGGPTRGYTLDLTHGGYLLTTEQLEIPKISNEFSANLANYRYWDQLTKRYFDQQLEGSKAAARSDAEYIADLSVEKMADTKAEKITNNDNVPSMRWNAAMVGDVHRILYRGGIFLYPADSRTNMERGKIRLLYEANPLGLLVSNAGGSAFSEGKSVLNILPTSLHQRVPITMGSIKSVEFFENTVKPEL